MARQVKQQIRGRRVVLYIRVSDVTGREKTLISDEVQIDACQRYCTREGLEVTKIIRDIDMTGRSFLKRSILKVIGMVDQGEVDGVIVWKISRWGRSHLDSMNNIVALQQAGGFILSATENLDDIETPFGRFSLTQMLAIAQLQSDQIGETWSNIHDYRRGQGLPHGGGSRFGYIYAPSQGRGNQGAYAVDPETGPWLAKAYQQYVSGLAMTQTLKQMNTAGIKTTRGNRWTYTSLKATLDSGFGAGKIVEYAKGKPGKIETATWHDGNHDPVVDEPVWLSYMLRRKLPIAARVKSPPYRSAGLVYCGSCGSRLRVTWRGYGVQDPHSNEGKYRMLRCPKIDRHVYTTDCPHPTAVKESRLNDAILKWLLEKADNDPAAQIELARANRAAVVTVDLERIDRDIASLTKQLVTATTKLVEGKLKQETFSLLEETIITELARLRASRSGLDVEVAVTTFPDVTAFRALIVQWNTLDPAIVNAGLQHLIGRIEIDGTTRKWDKRIKIAGRWELPPADPQ